MPLRNLQATSTIGNGYTSFWKALVVWLRLASFGRDVPFLASSSVQGETMIAGNHSSVSSFACPETIGSMTEIGLASSGILSLEKTDARLCTLTRVMRGTSDDDAVGVVPVAMAYDGNDWERAGGTYAASLPDWTCESSSSVCQSYLPAGSYELTHRADLGQNITVQEATVRFLEMASFGARPQDLTTAETFVPVNYVQEQMYQIPATYHREFYRRHANPHWRFHTPEFAANLDPCTQERDTTWRRTVVSVKEAYRNMHVKAWKNNNNNTNESYWEISIDNDAAKKPVPLPRTVLPRLRLKQDGAQLMEGTYEICAGLSDIRRGIYWIMFRGVCREIMSEDLYIDFPDGYTPENAMTGVLPSLLNKTSWQSSSRFLPEYILKTRVPASSCASLPKFNPWGPPVFARTASGEWLQFDPRIVMETNSLEKPLADGGAANWFVNRTLECAAARRNFMNEGSCIMSTGLVCVAGSSQKDQAMPGLVVCGSPGEVANDPSLGDHWLDIPSISTPALSQHLKVPRDTTGSEMLSKQKGFVWNTIALTSNDQLRQRVSWALLQIFALPGAAISSGRINTEMFLNYYDILREVSWNPLMAESLSYVNSRSLGFVYGSTSKEAFPDENYARELMQLFTIGVIKLNIDGTPVLDSGNKTISTYSNKQIESFARVWTGFQRQNNRANIEGHDNGANNLDPLFIEPAFRDRFPKTDLVGGYLGDGYPLCVSLPSHMHLRRNAKYRLLGRSPIPEQYENDFEWAGKDGVKRLVLQPGGSGLYSKLCGSTAGPCTHPGLVILDSDLLCKDNTSPECDVDTVRVVQVGAVFYEYVKNVPCVELAFFGDGVQAAGLDKRFESVCVNPNLAAASEGCCPKNVKTFHLVAIPECRYSGERMKLSTAIDRCESIDRELCVYNRLKENTACAHIGYHWTSSSCRIKAKVNNDGDVAIVHDMEKPVIQVSQDTINYFGVYWDNSSFPSPDNNCGNSVCAAANGACLCDVRVVENVIFTNTPSSKAKIFEALRIGAFKPSADDGYMSRSVSDFTYYSKSTDGACCDKYTVFEAIDHNGNTLFLSNIESKVAIGDNSTTWSFRNAPHFNSVNPGEYSEADAVHETEALLDHLFYHQNTPPFVAYRLIQRFGTSNPSPRYVKEVATAFKTGSYESAGKTFGQRRYGDLAATIAAVLLDREVQSIVADPIRGSLREPTLKVLSFLRAMDFQLEAPLVDLDLMEVKIGQAAYMQPTVFSYFRPEYQAPGEAASAGLASPEAEPMSAGKVVGILNGLFDLVDGGLRSCGTGFGLYGFCKGSPSGALAYKPANPSNRKASLEEMSALLTAGRLGPSKLSIIESVIANEPDDHKALQTGLKLLLTTPEFHASSQAAVSTNNEPLNAPQSSTTTTTTTQTQSGYKAVIHLTLQGGMDSFNMLVPHPKNCTRLNQEYKQLRDVIAVGDNGLLDIESVDGQPCGSFGIHSYFNVAQELYNDGDLLFLANTGILTEYVNKDNFKGKTETQLFGHSTLQEAIDVLDPRNIERGTGALGRLTDALLEAGYRSGRTAIETTPRNLAGRLEAVSPVFALDQGDVVPLDGNLTSPEMAEVVNALNDNGNGVYGEVWSSILRRSLNQTDKVFYLLRSTREANNTASYVPASNLARRFKLISQLIAARQERQVDRDMFTVMFEGFDMHGEVTETMKDRLGILNEALAQFVTELKKQNVWDQVVIVETSDFGRTLTPNSGGGTDHGWGGNYFMTGGNLKGKRILGKYPDSLFGELNIGRGRLIPTTPWESPFNAIAEWMGVTDPNQLDYVLPNRKSFPDLMGADSFFHEA